MFWKNAKAIFLSTSFRLTIWYAAIFAIASVTVYTIGHWKIRSNLRSRVNIELFEEIKEFEALYNKGLDAVDKEMREEEESEGIERGFFRFLTPDFKPLISTNMLHWQGIDEQTSEMLERLGKDEAIFEIKLPRRHYPSRIICKRMTDKNFLQIGFTIRQENKLLNEFTQVFSIVISVMIVMGCIIG